MKKYQSLVFVVIVVFSLSSIVVGAQEAAEEPEINLENVVADAANYYGQEITLEGVIENFINPYAFVFGEDALIDNDQVLVINRSGINFSPLLMESTRASVTGVIQPSREAWEDGAVIEGFEVDGEVGSEDYFGTLETEDNDDESVDNPLGTFDLDITSLYYNGRLAEQFDNYTLFVVTAVDDISVIEEE